MSSPIINVMSSPALDTKVVDGQSDFTRAVDSDSGMGEDAFLGLLVTQLANQDPLNPMSNEDFISQMAQLQSLEQLMSISKSFENMGRSQEIGSASALIGLEVTAMDDSETSTTGTITGVVESVSIVDGKARLVIDGKKIPMELVQEVSYWTPVVVPAETPIPDASSEVDFLEGGEQPPEEVTGE